MEPAPVAFVGPYTPAAAAAGKAAVLLLMGVAVWVRARLDRREGRHAGLLTVGLVLLAGAMTAWHWFAVDARYNAARGGFYVEQWQRDLYLSILNHRHEDAAGWSQVPHIYRPLPYGFTRSLERLTGDWHFACLAYRWFFTYLLAWAYYRFARLFLDPRRALLALVALPVLYPFSVAYYRGQLTDPVSHVLFVLGMIYIVQDRWLALAAAVGLGVLAKETAVVLVPAYCACRARAWRSAVGPAAVLGLTAAVAFVAVRLAAGWGVGYGAINGTTGLMIGTNLGIGTPLYLGAAPTYQNYLQVALFVGAFLPPIALRWRGADGRLKALFLTLTPLVLASSFCFSWLYESRNYVPLLPLLTTLALLPTARRAARTSAPLGPGEQSAPGPVQAAVVDGGGRANRG